MIEQINISNIIYFLILFAFVSLVLDRDENNLDRYDRYWAYEEKEYSRGITGVIYDKHENIDFWANLFDTNPLWN